MSIPTANALEGIAAPLAEAMGLTIWGIEILGGNRPIFRIYVEGEKGADIDECAELSRLLGLTLDVEDIMPGAYSLEVSSPGLERLFFSPEQLKNYTGQNIILQLSNPEDNWPGRKKFQGILMQVEGNTVSLQPNDTPLDTERILTTKRENIQRARLVHDFNANKGQKKGQPKARS